MSEAAKQVDAFFAALGATTTAVGYRGSFALAGFTQGAATTSVDGGFQWSARGAPAAEFTLNIPIPHRVDLVNLVPSMLTFSKTTCADALVAFPSHVNLQCSNVGNVTFLTIDQQFCSPVVANINAALYSALAAATSTTSTTTTITTTTIATSPSSFSSTNMSTLYPLDAEEGDPSEVDAGSDDGTTTASSTIIVPTNTSFNANSDTVTDTVGDEKASNSAGTVVPVVIVLLCLVAAGAAVLHYRKNGMSTAHAQAARELDGAQTVEMINNPMHNNANSNDRDVVPSNGDGDAVPATNSPIYDPPAWVPPAQEFPAYYSGVAAAPGTVAEYAAPNELGGSAVYEGPGDGVDASAALYASPTEGGAVYAAGGAAAYAYVPVLQTGEMYAASINTSGAGGGWDDGAVYSNDAYGNVAGSTTNA
jgi:hypothetical protein